MTKNPFLKFYPSDWRSDPALKLCSLSARGLWVEMLCIMHEAEPYGHLKVRGVPLDASALAALTGAAEESVRACLHELEDRGVLSRNREGVVFSRRMIRDAEKRARAYAAGVKGGDPDLVRLAEASGKLRTTSRFNRKDNPTKVRLVWEACGGHCTDCGIEMAFEHNNQPNAFEVDHIKPLTLGGTNAVENLRGICKACNLRAAKAAGRGASPAASPAPNPAANTQKPEARVNPSGSNEPSGSSTLRADVDRAFSELWAVWPSTARKRHTQDEVRKAINTQLRLGANADDLIAAGRKHVAERSAEGDQYVKGLKPWLTSGLWKNWVDEGGAASAERWDRRLEIWREHRDWNAAQWGPPPDQPGYRGPAIVIPFQLTGGAT